MKTSGKQLAIAALMAVALTSGAGSLVRSEDNGGRTDISVDCHCPDAVGLKFCDEFKHRIRDSAGYRLADSTKGYGMGVHFSCVDLWQGIDNQLAGTMSAVSVAFTLYADNLPGEVYEDSSVFRVGKEAGSEMSRKIIVALGQLRTVNAVFFARERGGRLRPSPAATPFVYPRAPLTR